MYANIKINGRNVPRSWEQLSAGEYLNMLSSGINPITFYSGLTLEEIEKKGLTNYFVYIFEFLLEPPELEKPGFDIGNKSIKQKLEALNILRKSKDKKIEHVVPYLTAIFSQLPELYSLEKAKEIYKELLTEPVLQVLTHGFAWFDALMKNEQELQSGLKKIPLSPEEYAAGVKDLEFLNNYALLDSLSNGNFLKIEEAEKQTVNKVNSRIIYMNNKLAYERRLQKVLADKMKRRK